MIIIIIIAIHGSIIASENISNQQMNPSHGATRIITHRAYLPTLSNVQNSQKSGRQALLINYELILQDNPAKFNGSNAHTNLHFRTREDILTSTRMSGIHAVITQKTPPKKAILVAIEQVQRNFDHNNQTAKENVQSQPTQPRPESSICCQFKQSIRNTTVLQSLDANKHLPRRYIDDTYHLPTIIENQNQKYF